MRKQALTFVLLITASVIFAQGQIPKGQPEINSGIGLSLWGVPKTIMKVIIHKEFGGRNAFSGGKFGLTIKI